MTTSSQTTSTLLMIRPASFGYNEQTAGSNAFQQKAHSLNGIEQSALKEFDAFVHLLRSKDVDVIVIEDTTEPHKPDAIFPNNWVSFHDNGDVLLYPMQAENRRYERNEGIIRKLESQFTVKHIIDLSRFELDDKFLEGTGSMVLDRENKLAYACLSPRTNAEVLLTFCHHLGFRPVAFNAADGNGKAIYHTNVMMCIGSKFAVICLDSITDTVEKQAVITSLQATEKEIVAISYEQMNQFAGNMLEVKTTSGKSLLVMSASAHRSLTEEQVNTLEKCTEIVSTDITTIETIGGGSARCMLAEIHLPALA
ncbi:citrulline utilization hydrolase CtlX [uncultured Mucilaginibacter sp.]|uniref:citrulline utilization hydrolase CtlX n=1 Tax=uncultured Mucilaginibacter sp. TaxID=797541 RepID=UPI0025DB4BE5|nr:arginine deiminase-related protein [uncultured Mucilaginibacter sp.]